MNLDKLKELAQAATPGPWRIGSPNARCKIRHSHGTSACRYTFEGWWDDGHEVSRACDFGPEDEPSKQETLVAGTWDYEEGGIRRAEDAAFIAAANPATVLVLIEVAEKAQAILPQLCDTSARGIAEADDLRTALSRLSAAGLGEGGQG